MHKTFQNNQKYDHYSKFSIDAFITLCGSEVVIKNLTIANASRALPT